jgi:hypothetical protein
VAKARPLKQRAAQLSASSVGQHHGMVQFRLAVGQDRGSLGNIDALGLFQQLGVIPAMA